MQNSYFDKNASSATMSLLNTSFPLKFVLVYAHLVFCIEPAKFGETIFSVVMKVLGVYTTLILMCSR